jgi:diguanylate cyclase (GGDEF)-like protein
MLSGEEGVVGHGVAVIPGLWEVCVTATAKDRVLGCATLPSLPGVAMRVLDLIRDSNVSISSLADAVQTDPAMVTKVLKTVNSSYYGLTVPCPSIQRAMSLLGLNTVKSIVLGFSLVDFSKAMGKADGKFDMSIYWRRAIYSAAAARAVARHTKRCDGEEAFIAALVADIGVLACLSALKGEYGEVLAAAGDDHDKLAGVEQQKLGATHASIGMDLASKWRLPAQLAACIGYHHSPELCKPEHLEIVRTVMLGRFAAGALTGAGDPKRQLGSFILRGLEWAKIERDVAKKLLEATTQGATELTKLLEVKTGAAPDMTEILSQAQEALVETQMEMQRTNVELTKKTVTDGLTGAFNRPHFDQELARLFAQANLDRKALAVLFIDGDRFKSINDTFGHAAGDAVLKELAKRAQATVGQGGSVFRYGGEEFAVLLPQTDLTRGAAIADMVRVAMESKAFDIGEGKNHRVTISVGVSAWTSATDASIGADHVVHAADQAVYSAKRSGRNRVCLCVPGSQPTDAAGQPVVEVAEEGRGGPAPASATAPTKGAPAAGGAKAGATSAKPGKLLMIVEDDPLAARLLEFLFAKKSEFAIMIKPTAEKALEWLSAPNNPKPVGIICDLHLPGMDGANFAKIVAQQFAQSPIPVLIATAAGDEKTKAACMKAGATLFVDKAQLCTDFDTGFEHIRRVIAQSTQGTGAAKRAA